MKGRKKAILDAKECVACGCCAKSCPLNAMSIGF
ncbi:MAG TPA: 4Fe-4S binding protein [Clostridiales bacterium]|nr:4Fe-4S binding protein [Clostridiales bacterium]